MNTTLPKHVLIDERPLRLEWNGRTEVLKIQLVAFTSGCCSLWMLQPETNEFLGEWDQEMGGGLYMFGVDLERNESEYIRLEELLFKLLHKEYPGFFDYHIVDNMA